MQTELYSYNYNSLWDKVPDNMKVREDEKISLNEYLFILKKSGIRSDYIGTNESKKINESKYLKLFDFEKSGNINIISKRKQLRGRVCTSLMVSALKKILNRLEEVVIKYNIPNIIFPNTYKQKILRPNICLQIEFLLRVLNDNTDSIWFYEGYFTKDDIE